MNRIIPMDTYAAKIVVRLTLYDIRTLREFYLDNET